MLKSLALFTRASSSNEGLRSKITNLLKRDKKIDYAAAIEETRKPQPQIRLTNDAMDEIRARGVLKVRQRHEPTTDVAATIERFTHQVVSKGDEKTDWRQINLDKNPVLKFKLLTLCERTFKGHTVSNSKLHELRTVADVIDFYSTPTNNFNKYHQLARDETIPTNLHILTHPQRFHPEDKDKPHKGITAFPGSKSHVYSLRNQRLFRSYNTQKEWYEWSDVHYDHSHTPPNAPWHPEKVKQMDRVSRSARFDEFAKDPNRKPVFMNSGKAANG